MREKLLCLAAVLVLVEVDKTSWNASGKECGVIHPLVSE